MDLNGYSKLAHDNSVRKGFYVDNGFNFSEKIMLMVCELSECVEAHRKEKVANLKRFDETYFELISNLNEANIDAEGFEKCKEDYFKSAFKEHVKDTVEDELADCMIRIFDLCGHIGIDIKRHVELKMRYNLSRPYMHGKKY